MRVLVVLVVLVLALAGCSESKDGRQTARDCSPAQAFNAYEGRCVSQFEACRGWLQGQADEGQTKTTCQADSDGHAFVEYSFGMTGTIHVTVRDGAGAVVYENNLGNGNGHAKLTGQSGAWSMAIDFGTATGSGEVKLWG